MKSFIEFLKESEEIDEMSNKRINAAYDKVTRKYGQTMDDRYKNIKNFWHTTIYNDNDLIIATNSQNLLKNMIGFLVYKNKQYYTFRVYNKLFKRLSIKFTDDFDNVDVYEFMRSLPEEALDAIAESIKKSFEIDIDREKLLKLTKESK